MNVDYKHGQELEASSSHHLAKGMPIQNFPDFDEFCITSFLNCIALSVYQELSVLVLHVHCTCEVPHWLRMP